MPPNSVRLATPDDSEPAGESLAGAFASDPLFQWMLGTEEPAASRLIPLFRSLVKVEVARPQHLTYVSADCRAAAIWQGVGAWKTSMRQWVPALPAMIRSFRFGLFMAARLMPVMDRAHPTEPHYYLEVVGSRPDSQGQGLGSAVIEPMLERCDEEGLPAYLENSNPQNAAFYGRHGFVDRGLLEMPDGAPPVQAMWREPR